MFSYSSHGIDVEHYVSHLITDGNVDDHVAKRLVTKLMKGLVLKF